MLKRLKGAAVGCAALLVTSVAAYSAGYFPGFPIVGGAAYCQGTSTGVSGQVCTDNVPAGPSTLTGTELIPADTGYSQGQAPQTVYVPLAALGALPTQYATPLTGTSVTVAPTTGTMLIDPAGTIATLTVVLPVATSLIDGQVLRLASSQTVTALTLTPGTGTTVSNAPSAITISTTAPYNYEFIYKASNTKWYRVQ